MTRTTTGIACIAVTALLLGGCFDSEADQKAREQQEASDNFWNITPPDESQDKGFKP
ncbi:hypothetical protein [Pseudomonas putida]|uniref:hypothetical protein n=1 Tax=Pseudomonas putida TaxID=303 RepID=UPI0018ABBF56|nr:hypothetical protein [Pseudomonas putida]MBF8726802.1 hypothetical protein [Pseudomonas putida]